MRALNILAVDDEEVNLELLSLTIQRLGCKPIEAHDGQEAWEYLNAHPEEVDLVILDRMMPKMTGTYLSSRIHQNPDMQHIPIVFQSGKVGANNHVEAVDAGAQFYLTKPFARQDLVDMIRSAAYRVDHYRILRQRIREIGYPSEKIMAITCLEDVYDVAAKLARFFPEKKAMIQGIFELLLNAFEHGVLGIGFELKSQLIREDNWLEEIYRRSKLPENADRHATVSIEYQLDKLSVVTRDPGEGFDWQRYITFDPDHVTRLNGRGCADAHRVIPGLEYRNNGSEARFTVKISK